MYEQDESLISFLVEFSHNKTEDLGSTVENYFKNLLKPNTDVVKELLQSSKQAKDLKRKNAKRLAPKDELENATSNKRAFKRIYDEAKWLNAFAMINQVAAQKLIKKLTKKMTLLG